MQPAVQSHTRCGMLACMCALPVPAHVCLRTASLQPKDPFPPMKGCRKNAVLFPLLIRICLLCLQGLHLCMHHIPRLQPTNERQPTATMRMQ